MHIHTLISLLDWRSVIDVTLLGIVVFLFYKTLRSTGSWRIGVGIIVALFVYVVASLIQLPGVMWIFKNLSNIALIALVIIFQPEIRKIFERTASTFKIKKLLKESSTFVRDIAHAAFVLAQRKWGAIIIVPGKEEVSNKISGGFSINADVSIPLLLSIFDPHSPGHDGAMVVENGKIVGFGYRLPLSSSETLGYQFGTRHHASLGLSEVTDALIITVSEERGTVTVFRTGQYIVMKSEDELINEITHHLKTISRWFSYENTKGVRIVEAMLSLVIAFCVWVVIAVNTSQAVHRTYTIPIQYNLPPKMVIVGEKVQMVKISVSGNPNDIESIKPYELRGYVDLSHAQPGKHTITLHQGNFNLYNSNVRVIDIEPSHIQLTLRVMEQKDLDIKPQIVGSVPPGFEITSIDVNPPKIAALYTTELSDVENIYLTTEPIYVNNLQQSVKIMTKIVAPDGVYPVDTTNWPDITVIIYIRKK